MISYSGKRILHVFGQMVHGGAEMRTLELMRHIDRRAYKLDFCVLSGLPGPLDSEIRALGGEVHPCRLGPTFAYRFRRLLRERRFDVVHAHVHYFSGLILLLAARCGIPGRVVHFRTPHDGRASGLLRRIQRGLLRHWIDRYATHILAVSRAAMTGAWRADWQADPRCQVIYNGLPPAAFEGPADRERVLCEFGFPSKCLLAIHVGRLAPEKNHARLLRIFRVLQARNANARLLIVGSGNRRSLEWLQNQIEALGISDCVVAAGERTDVPRLLGAADVLIFPSLWEGLPGAVLEASAAGTPVVASNLPALREIASDFPSVYCVSLGEPDTRWVEAVEEAAGSKRSEPGRLAVQRRFARSAFAIDQAAKRICRVWEDALAQALPGGPQNG